MDFLGVSPPKVRVPYQLMYMMAFLMELMYSIFGIEPLMTRFEINVMSITHTFSIKNAIRDLGYRPKNNHSLEATIRFYKEMGVENKVNTLKSAKLGLHAIAIKTFMVLVLALVSSVFVPYFVVKA